MTGEPAGSAAAARAEDRGSGSRLTIHHVNLTVFVVVAMFATALLGTFLLFSHRAVLSSVRSASANEAEVLAYQFNATIKRIQSLFDFLLTDSVALRGLMAVPDEQGLRAVDEQIRALVGTFPEIDNYFVHNAQGEVVAAAGIRLSMQPEPYLPCLAVLPEPSESGLHFSEVVFCEEHGTYVLFVQRMVGNDRGEFAGSISVAVNLAHFVRVFAEIEVGTQGMVSIRRSDTGRLVVRHPSIFEKIGNAAPDIPPQLAIDRGTRAGVVRYVGRTDDVDRIFAFRTVGSYPFYVLIGRAVDEQFAQWRLTSAVAVGFWLAAIAVIGGLLRQRSLALVDLKVSKARYAAIVQALPDALCRVLPNTTVTFANARFSRLSGIDESIDPTGRRWADLVHNDAKAVTEQFARLVHECNDTGCAFAQTLEDTQHGGERVVEWSIVPIFDEHRRIAEFQCIGRDVTDQHRQQQRIKNALLQKESLLQELFHRTNNNMQFIQGIMLLRSAGNPNIELPAFVQEINRRIAAIALVHQQLLASGNVSWVDLGAYLHELAGCIVRDFPELADRVALEFDTEPVSVLFDIASPVGLVVSELLSNAFVHAFPPPRCGVVRIALHETSDGMIELQVADSGVGTPSPLDLATVPSLGLSLATALVTDQLKGTITVTHDVGLTFTVRFKDNVYVDRVPRASSTT